MVKFKKVKKLVLASVIGGGSLSIIPLQSQAAQVPIGGGNIHQISSYGKNIQKVNVNTLAPTTTKWKMDVYTDTLGITSKVNEVLQNTVFQNITRELTDSTFSIANNRYNVIMFTSQSNYEYHFQGTKFQAKVNFRGNQYDLYVFENGKFYKDTPNSDTPWSWGYRGWTINQSTPTSYIHFYLP
ncbi:MULTISPECIES: hypothetical protein [Bacillus cereus group]|uniref:Uncharacterized protein n=1 Tax=Bacillus thuringiensis TaxID=1428 RepID=A0A9X7AG06_BACTU|nr:hypothetical protein [Bacillus thuringiensis]MCQ6337985.1 hypothetical protein [Bacillus cereus]PFT30908.1 hypothetical protein COK72_32500 [Bacillus thuringiensis]